MTILQIIILAVIQGFAELLPVSSSAHVILAQHLMGLNPSSPEMTFFLVMLHTGTMFAVLVYFWKRWKERFRDAAGSREFIKALILATVATGVLGLSLKILIEKVVLEHFLHYEKGEVENLFSILPLVAAALFVSGVLITISGLKLSRKKGKENENTNRKYDRKLITNKDSVMIGLIQGLCLPFRGLSRSGATISVGLMTGLSQIFVEEFSFALAILITPPAIFMELRRLLKADPLHETNYSVLMYPGLLGMVFSFAAGLLALRWLAAWLEKGKWTYFGYYCLVLSAVVALT